MKEPSQWINIFTKNYTTCNFVRKSVLVRTTQLVTAWVGKSVLKRTTQLVTVWVRKSVVKRTTQLVTGYVNQSSRELHNLLLGTWISRRKHAIHSAGSRKYNKNQVRMGTEFLFLKCFENKRLCNVQFISGRAFIRPSVEVEQAH